MACGPQPAPGEISALPSMTPKRLLIPVIVLTAVNLGLPEKIPAPQHTVQVEHKGYKPFIISGIIPEPTEATLEHYLYSRGIQFIEQQAEHKTNQPWALVLSALAPHDPYIVPRQYFELYDPRVIPQPASFHDNLADRPAIYRTYSNRSGRIWNGSISPQITASYYAFCSMIDDQVGRVLEACTEPVRLKTP